MKQNENHWHDDETIEIVDLSAEEKGTNRSPLSLPGSKTVQSVWQWSHQHRRLSLLFSVGCLSLTLLILAVTALPLPQLLTGQGLRRTPPPIPLSGPDLFYFAPLPTWGTVLIDGRPLPQVPVPIVDNAPPIRLPAGQHLLIWHADPFEEYHCVLLVPPRSGPEQTCQVTPAPATSYATSSSLITIPVSLAQLPAPSRRALIQKAQALLDTLRSVQTVQPGEPYAVTEQEASVRIATAPLQAQLSLALQTEMSRPVRCTGERLGEGCTLAGLDCRLFCTPLWPKTAQAAWDVVALFRPVWQYTDGQGHPLSLGQEQDSDQFVSLHITWQQSQWQVSFQRQGVSSFDDPLCTATIGVITTSHLYQSLPGATSPLPWGYASAKMGDAACLAVTRIEPFSSGSTGQTGDALLLTRFGVIMAANAAAHSIWPHLPLADTKDQLLAQELQPHIIW